MSKATAQIFIDKSHPKANGLCAISIKITNNRERKYYKTDIELQVKHFNKIIVGKFLKVDESNTLAILENFITRAKSIIEKLPIFTFNLFEKQWYKNKVLTDTLSGAFNDYIAKLELNEQVGTAMSYTTAKNAFNKFEQEHKKKQSDKNFVPSWKLTDVTPELLKAFEKSYTKNEKSITSIAIYCRCIRSIFNYKKVPRNIQPFFIKHFNDDGYKITTGDTIKKALSIEQINAIYNYTAKAGTNTARAKDYFIFMLQSNGMNVNDMCNLKWNQIDFDNGFITYIREKTKGKSDKDMKIRVSIKQETKDIIKQWSAPSVLPNAYVFPHYKQAQTAKERKETVQLLIRSLNNHLAIISNNLKLNVKVTTQFARHSFATILKRSNVSTERISEALGHNSLKTTRHYLDNFENEQIHSDTEILTDILIKQAN
jgi:integrase/recombinase XerD